MADIKQMIGNLTLKTDVSNARLEKKFDDVTTQLRQALSEEIKATVDPIKEQQAELLAMFTRLENRVASVEAGVVADDDAMSDSSGAAAPVTKKTKVSFPNGNSGASSSTPAAPLRRSALRSSSVPGSGARAPKKDNHSKEEWALCATGFGRKVSRTIGEGLQGSCCRLPSRYCSRCFFLELPLLEVLPHKVQRQGPLPDSP